MADHISAHQYCSNNRKQLEQVSSCGCIYCRKIFNPIEIAEWIPEKLGTAVCPYCGIDAVIAESSSVHITSEFLDKMNHYWFG